MNIEQMKARIKPPAPCPTPPWVTLPWQWMRAVYEKGHGGELSGALLALDLGTVTGWALRSGGQVISTGSQSFKPGRFDGAGMRFLRFKRWLTELKGADGFDAVYFEEVRRHVGADAARCYGGFFGVLTAWCEHHEIPYQGVPVGTIKRFATGKGNADKPAMIAAAVARGYSPEDDNEADAIALLHMVIKEHEARA